MTENRVSVTFDGAGITSWDEDTGFTGELATQAETVASRGARVEVLDGFVTQADSTSPLGSLASILDAGAPLGWTLQAAPAELAARLLAAAASGFATEKSA